jgi:hypothetical protein
MDRLPYDGRLQAPTVCSQEYGKIYVTAPLDLLQPRPSGRRTTWPGVQWVVQVAQRRRDPNSRGSFQPQAGENASRVVVGSRSGAEIKPAAGGGPVF